MVRLQWQRKHARTRQSRNDHENSSALTSVCTPSSGNGILRRRTEAVVSADGGRHSGNEHSSAHASFLESICMHARRRIPVCICVCVCVHVPDTDHWFLLSLALYTPRRRHYRRRVSVVVFVVLSRSHFCSRTSVVAGVRVMQR